MRRTSDTHTAATDLSDPRVRRTRKAFRLALQELLQEAAFEQITIRDIVARADIAYTPFFRHYPTKEALLADLADEEIGQLLDLSLPMISSENSIASCQAVCDHVVAGRALWSALLTGGAQGAIRSASVEQTLAREEKWLPAQSWLPRDIGITLASRRLSNCCLVAAPGSTRSAGTDRGDYGPGHRVHASRQARGPHGNMTAMGKLSQ